MNLTSHNGRWVGLAVAAVLLAGCARSNVAVPPGPLRELHLLTMPVAVNLDDLPGADGFHVKVYGVSPKNPKPVPIRQGTLEILMFDGNPSGSFHELTPLCSWQFQPEQLLPFEVQTSIGVGYNLTLRWETKRPRERRVTVVGRYRLGDNPFIYSGPSSLAVVDV